MATHSFRRSHVKALTLIGHRFGRWIVEDFDRVKPLNRPFFLCRCDCGTARSVYGSSLTTGRSLSCGCLTKERHHYKHGGKAKNDSLYNHWIAMKSRCHNPNSTKYPIYGGRGITVCSEWKDSYSNFRDWSYHYGYKKGLQIDRLDNNGPYSPENCRWATNKQNSRNRSNNHWVTVNGVTKTLVEWVEEVSPPDITYGTVRARISIGWPELEALTAPRYSKLKNCE